MGCLVLCLYYRDSLAKAMATHGPAIHMSTSEKELRDLAKNASKILPKFDEKEGPIGVK